MYLSSRYRVCKVYRVEVAWYAAPRCSYYVIDAQGEKSANIVVRRNMFPMYYMYRYEPSKQKQKQRLLFSVMEVENVVSQRE